MQTVPCAALLAAVMSSTLLADVIFLKNGERLDGKVVAETEDELKVELQKKGMTLTVNVKREDVDRIETSRELDTRREEFDKRRKELAALPAGFDRVTRLFDLGLWAREGGLYPEAVAAFEEARDSLPEFEDVADLEVARTHLAAQDHEACRKALEALFERNPNHEQAKLLATELADSVQEEVTDDTEKGFEYYAQGNCRRALGIFVNFVNKHPRHEADLVSKKCEEKTGRPLAAIMAECRFRQGCPEPGCLGGWKHCPRPTCDKGRKVTYLKPGEGRPDTKENYCGTCRGIRYLMCERCKAIGIYLGTPTAWERDEFTRILAQRAKKMVQQALGLVEKAAEIDQVTDSQAPKDAWAERTQPGAGAAPGKLDPMTVISRARRARRFLKNALELSPEKALAEVPEAHAQIEALDDLSFETARKSADDFIQAAETLYNQAVGPEGGLPLDVTGLYTRMGRAYDGMELAERARMFLSYVLKDTSDSPSPHVLEARRQLEMATNTAERCRLAYQRMKRIQDELDSLVEDPDKRGVYYRQAREDLSRLLQDLKNMRDEVR